MNSVTWNNFANLGYIHTTLPEYALQLLRNEVGDIRNNFNNATKHNGKLVGHIKQEYTLSNIKEMINTIVYMMADNYFQIYPQYRTKNNVMFPGNNYELVVADIWVNFQQKHEYNPIHSHSGVLSFVIWLDIPFLCEDERKHFPDILEEFNSTSCFSFHYTDILGDIISFNIAADKKLNGTMIMFPSKLHHSVNPFYTSDEYRITISGNLHYK